MELDLQGKWVLITGASGDIGQAIAEAFAEEGARLALHYNGNVEPVRNLQARLHGVTEAFVFQADLSVPEQASQLVNDVWEKTGGIDIIVNNAGVSLDGIPATDIPFKELDRLYRINLLAPFLVSRQFMRCVKRAIADGKHLEPVVIVNIGSTAGLYGEANNAWYGALKAGLMNLTRSLAGEIGRLLPGSRVVSVVPGWVKGRMSREAIKNIPALSSVLQTRKIPDLTKPNDVACDVVMTASQVTGRMMTGCELLVDGGMDERVQRTAEECIPFAEAIAKQP